MHKRNLHKNGYPLPELCAVSPDLRHFIVQKPNGDSTVNFTDPKSVKSLNAALLKYYYKLKHWDIPANFLCPPVPGRADYVHHIADLLSQDNAGNIPTGKHIKGLDIGTGANFIYPIIAQAQYGWKILGSDIDTVSIASAKAIINANPHLLKSLTLKVQRDKNAIFAGIVQSQDYFDFCMCNPPFHSSANEAQQHTDRKNRNLKRNKQQRQSSINGSFTKQSNFGGQANELWCEGGELAFISQMITESKTYSKQITWFTSLVSKHENLTILMRKLNAVEGLKDIKTIEMTQGNKKSRFIAWRF